MLTELLLLHISGILTECEKKSDKYAQFQMGWYVFSGKVLCNHTDIISIDDILSAYITSLLNFSHNRIFLFPQNS